MRSSPLLVPLLSIFAVVVSADSLYDSSDPILELDTETFNAAVYNTKKAHFIEFYSSWCGACIGYAPTFKKFARHLATWAPMVQVTVVNCADDKNMPLCREHSINAFPTLKYFKYLSENKDDGLLYQGNKHDLAALELDVAGLVQADYERQKPEQWPSFAPVDNTASLDTLWSTVGSVKYLGLAIQENPATMAWANLINFHNDRYVRIVLVRPQHPDVVKHLGANANGRFLLFAAGNSMPVWTSPENVAWIDVQEKVNELATEAAGQAQAPAPERVYPVPAAQEDTQGAAPVEGVPAVNLKQFEVQLVDLQSTVSYMLYKEIPRRAVIDGEDLAGLKQWTHAMKKYAPGTTPMRRLYFRLDEWLQLRDRITAEEWTAKLDEIQQSLGNPLPAEIKWMACAGSKSNLRGYTCGLWTMAHTITVEAYNLEKSNPDFKPVIEVFEPFRQFITRFLSCSECAANFQKETEKHQMHLVTRREDVVTWLWRVHNYVNTRLSGSASDDPKFPKRQFPPKEVCATCYDASGAFDEAKTFEFLKGYYGNIKQDKLEDAPGYKVNEYKDGKLQAAGSRRLNPKFAVHAEKVDKLEASEARLRKELDTNPQRQWRDIDGYDGSIAAPGRTQFYLIWLSVIGVIAVFAYCKYRRNRSKFWKTFYYPNDFKLCPWSSGTANVRKYAA